MTKFNRGELFDLMITRRPTTFQDPTTNHAIHGLIQAIGVEDGSGFNFIVTVQTGVKDEQDIFVSTAPGNERVAI